MSKEGKLRSPIPSRLCLALWIFALANGILLNAALPRVRWQPQLTTTLDYTRVFFERGAHSDSWAPMRTALFFVDEPRTKPLYTVVYFENNVRFQYPPSSLLVLEGLRMLPIEHPIGNDLLNSISWLSIVLLFGVVARIFYLARKRYGIGSASRLDETLYIALAVLVTLTFYPIVRGYYLGQVQVWIDLLIATIVWAWLEGRRRVAGVLVSLICVFKPTLALLVIWGAVRRHWDFMIGFAIPMSFFAIVSLAMYGWENHVDYLGVLSYISRHGEIFHPNQSMNGFLNRLFGNGNPLIWARSIQVPYHPWVHAGTLLSSLALLGLGLVFGYRRKGAETESDANDPIDLAIVILCSTLAVPTVWVHHYGVTLPLYALALPAVLALTRSGRVGLLVALVISFILISDNFRVVNRLALTPFNFLQSYVYFGGLLLLATLCIAKRRLDDSLQSSSVSASASRS